MGGKLMRMIWLLSDAAPSRARPSTSYTQLSRWIDRYILYPDGMELKGKTNIPWGRQRNARKLLEESAGSGSGVRGAMTPTEIGRDVCW